MTPANLGFGEPLSTPALTPQPAAVAPLPALFDGVDEALSALLGISGLRHRSALISLGNRATLPTGIVDAAYAKIAVNWTACHDGLAPTRSNANWRWHAPQLGLADRNGSAEVRLERELMAACQRTGRLDWSNQVPVASGIGGASRQRRRAIDLVHQKGPGHFQMIELKVASDTPLYAAVEIIGYACIWLLTRSSRADNLLLAANRIDVRVLAPAAYYARYELDALTRLLDAEMAALGKRHGVELSFDFDQFPDALLHTFPSDQALMHLLDHRQSV